jgi:hypothetical protein
VVASSHRVARDLEQPTGEGAVAPETPKLRERGGEHCARDVLAHRLVASPQPHIAEDTVEVAVVQREKRLRLLTRGRHEVRIRIDRPGSEGGRLEERPQFHDLLILHRPFRSV